MNIRWELPGANTAQALDTGFKYPHSAGGEPMPLRLHWHDDRNAKALLFHLVKKPAVCFQGALQGDLWIHPGPRSGHRAL